MTTLLLCWLHSTVLFLPHTEEVTCTAMRQDELPGRSRARDAQDFRPGGPLDEQLVCTNFTQWQAITDMVPFEMVKVINCTPVQKCLHLCACVRACMRVCAGACMCVFCICYCYFTLYMLSKAHTALGQASAVWARDSDRRCERHETLKVTVRTLTWTVTGP